MASMFSRANPHVDVDQPPSTAGETEYAADTGENRTTYLESTAANLLSLMDIPSSMLTSFLDFYHQYVGEGGDLSQLNKLDISMATAQPPTIDRRRRSSVRRMSGISQYEQMDISASDRRPLVALKQFVADMKEEFWLFNEDEIEGPEQKKKKTPSSSSWIDIFEAPWSNALKKIEGRFGAAVMSYFSFLQHIMLVNAVVFLLMLLVVVPHYVLSPVNQSSAASSADNRSCSDKYASSVQKLTEHSDWHDYPVYIFTGTGIMERNFFYGMLEPYYNISILGKPALFDMSLTTSVMPLICLFVSLLLIMARTSQYLSSTIRASKHAQSTRYTIQVLSSWKYSIVDPKGCLLQKALIKNKFLNMLSKDAVKAKSRARKLAESVLLFAVRFIGIIITLALLATCGVLVYLVQIFSDESLSNSNGANQAMNLALSFLPSFTVTALYLIVRKLFDITVRLESYSQEVTLVISIVRAASLRIASLLLLFVTFFSDTWTCTESNLSNQSNQSDQTTVTIMSSTSGSALTSTNRVCGNCRAASEKEQTYCWESYVGQQLYKLIIVDFLMVMVSVFLIETPRRLLHDTFKHRFFIVRKIGLPEFDIPKLVLDVAYSQTLCWVSTLFCPFIPAITFITTAVRFYSQKYSLQRNFKITEGFSSSSEVRVMFLLLLCPFLIFSLVIILICVIYLPPSQGCGPFRELSEKGQMLIAISNALEGSTIAKEVLKVITDKKFLLGLIFLMSIVIYCFKAVSQGTDKLIELLEQSRARMITDKRALWAKINSKMKQVVEQLDRPSSRGGPGAGFAAVGSLSSSAEGRTVAETHDSSESQVHYGDSRARALLPPQLTTDGIGMAATNSSRPYPKELTSSDRSWRHHSPVLRADKPFSPVDTADGFSTAPVGSRLGPSPAADFSSAPTTIATKASKLSASRFGSRPGWESSTANPTMSPPFAGDQRQQIAEAGGGREMADLATPSALRPYHSDQQEAEMRYGGDQPVPSRQVSLGGRLPRRRVDFN